MTMYMYELVTTSGEYEDFRSYVLYRSTDKTKVQQALQALKKKLEAIMSKDPIGVTNEDVETYEVGDIDGLSIDKINIIQTDKWTKNKISDLSPLEIRKVPYDGMVSVKSMLDILGI
jgi:hypothetical protein